MKNRKSEHEKREEFAEPVEAYDEQCLVIKISKQISKLKRILIRIAHVIGLANLSNV